MARATGVWVAAPGSREVQGPLRLQCLQHVNGGVQWVVLLCSWVGVYHNSRHSVIMSDRALRRAPAVYPPSTCTTAAHGSFSELITCSSPDLVSCPHTPSPGWARC
jgi:hypothetical protein